jgi:membrane protease YdiL (CAAX protease family)
MNILYSCKRWIEEVTLKQFLVYAAILAFTLAVLTGNPHPAQAVTPDTPQKTESLWSLVPLYAIMTATYATLTISIIKGEARGYWHYFRKVSLKSLVSSLIPLLGFIIAFYCLRHVKWLDHSWQYHLSNGKSGSLATMPLSLPFIGVLAYCILLCYLPYGAYVEEEVFRKGTIGWKDGVRRSLIFGLVHCTMGVNLVVGLALTIPGLWFTLQYFRGGVERSTIYHLSYNLVVITLFMCLLLV